ncbi:unnamed protein product [Soboliphyme baturini]|uniref:Uncharacterized protein n=1 Tax=Soboliphyme baturini TaxID=241478 RepID=A0A183IWG3_9BILA|nr:unnamed protein product [Soboliphyme baturini]
MTAWFAGRFWKLRHDLITSVKVVVVARVSFVESSVSPNSPNDATRVIVVTHVLGVPAPLAELINGRGMWRTRPSLDKRLIIEQPLTVIRQEHSKQVTTIIKIIDDDDDDDDDDGKEENEASRETACRACIARVCHSATKDNRPGRAEIARLKQQLLRVRLGYLPACDQQPEEEEMEEVAEAAAAAAASLAQRASRRRTFASRSKSLFGFQYVNLCLSQRETVSQ